MRLEVMLYRTLRLPMMIRYTSVIVLYRFIILQGVGLALLTLLLAYSHNNLFSGGYVMIEVSLHTHCLEYYV